MAGLAIKPQLGRRRQPGISDTGSEGGGGSGHTWISRAGQAVLQLGGSHRLADSCSDTKPRNYPATHTGHEAIKRLLKCHLLNHRFQLINPRDLEVPGGHTLAVWLPELPRSLEDELAVDGCRGGQHILTGCGAWGGEQRDSATSCN